MKRTLLILTCLAVLLSLAGCAEATVTDYDETHYSDSDVTEADEPEEVEEPAPKYTGHISTADLTDCTVTAARMFDVQALNDPIALTDDDLTELIAAIENAEIAEEPTELEDFDSDSVVTHYAIALSDGSEIELSSYEEYIVINGELFTIDEESLSQIESYYLEIYAEDYKIHEICYAEYKLQTGEWSEACYNQVRYKIPRNSFYIANPDGNYFSTGDWEERTEREQAELDEILAGIDDILPYVLKDDGTVNEDRFVNDGEMIPYKIDEPVNPLLSADFDGCAVYAESVYTTSTGSVQMDEDTGNDFLTTLMSLEMDETPTVDDNAYDGGVFSVSYTIVLSDSTEYRIYFMSVSAPVGNGLSGSARYVIVNGYKYCVTNSDVDDLFVELTSYYSEIASSTGDETLEVSDTEAEATFTASEVSEFCDIISQCANVAPGTAGSSLRSVSAAGRLLDWAQEHSDMVNEEKLAELLSEWELSCEDLDWEFENLSESWESVTGSINEIVSDPTDESLLGLLEDAGYSLQYDEYDEEIAELLISFIENYLYNGIED
ncbi:MAG: hypothetical protein LUF29_09805 [Oscillospiraceae bacterium]|nr:hypothetical protein [Oscillospiraceae bacterium]